MILAKPVIANQYWILKQDDKKIGEVEADDRGYKVRINDRVSRFKTIPMMRRQANITFTPPEKTTKPPRDRVHGFETHCRVHNPMWDIKKKLPLFTKSSKSKSWFAAGWYAVQQHRSWTVCFNPKLIILERYRFQGPFHSEEQARAQCI